MIETSIASIGRPRRHDLIWIDRHGAGFDCCGGCEASRWLVAQWIAAGRPFVVARQPSAVRETRQTLRVGLALPPQAGKVRIAIDVAANTVARIEPPAALRSVVVRMTDDWRPALSSLQNRSTDAAIELRVFGSVAWQALTGLRYVTSSSDLDVLWKPGSRSQLARGMSLLASWERASGIRLDGEILFGGDSAVALREWRVRHRSARVLVKTLFGATLQRPVSLLAQLDREHSASREAAA